MTLAFRTYKKNGRTYGGIVDNFRDPATGKSRTSSVHRYGNLDRLKEENPDFMKEVEAELTRLRQDPKYHQRVNRHRALALCRDQIPDGDDAGDTSYSPIVKFGEVILRRCWEELELHKLFWRLRTELKTCFDIDAAAYCLVAGRLTSPGSKKRCFQEAQMGLFNYSALKLDQLYDVLDVLYHKKSRIIKHLNSHIAQLRDRDLTIALYDVTTFYFESFDEDAVRAHGMSKEHRTAETQVVMGLLIDTDGLPIDYELFRGNTHEMGTMLQVIDGYLKRLGISNVTIVADAGLNSKQNLVQLQEKGMKFIVAQSMRKLPSAYLERVLGGSADDWECDPGQYDQWRSREVAFPITCTMVGKDGRKSKATIDTRLIVNYSKKRYDKDSADIDNAIIKASKLLAQGDSAIESGKSKRYAMLAKFGVGEDGKPTDKPLAAGDKNYTYGLNNKLIKERKRVAGYYAFITNDTRFSKMDQYHRLRSLWHIEDCFRVMKTFLAARPVYVRTHEHIRGHFVMCYIALVIERLCLQTLKDLHDRSFSTDRLVSFLNGPAFTKIASVKCSTQVLTKCVGGSYAVTDKAAQAELSKELDAILSCFGIPQLFNSESAQSIYKKFGVSLKFNELLTSSG